MEERRTGPGVAAFIIATLGPLVAASLGWWYDVPVWSPAALAGAAGLGLLARDRQRRLPWAGTVFRLVVCVVAGAWTAWSTVTGPWHAANLIAGVAAAVIGGFVAPAFLDIDPPAQLSTVGQLPAVVGRVALWKDRIERLARVQPVTVTGVEDWPNDAGFTLHVAFAPESGDTWRTVGDVAHRLAAAAHLRKGCVISVDEGDLQGTAVVRIPTVYAMAGEVALPEDTSPLSVWDDLPIGVHEDTTTAEVNLRQASGLFGGRRGSGKTNLEKVLIRQLLRCEDSLIWVADLNGGGLAVPFMLPYAEGQVTTPPIDWVASTPAEVVAMAQVAAAIAADRKARYAALTARSGGDLLPVTRDLPQITIVVDESAEVDDDPAARGAMDALLKVQRIGRAEAVNVIFSALRATQDTVPVQVRKQASLKICTQVEDDTEIGYMFPDAKVRAADLVHPGTAFIRRGDLGTAVRQMKIYRALPDELRRTVLATVHRRPSLDDASQQVGGRVYAQRWERAAPWLARLAGKPVDAPAVGLPQAMCTLIQAGVVQADDATRETLAKADRIEQEQHLSPHDRAERREHDRMNLRRFAAGMEIREMPKDQLDGVFAELVGDLCPDADEAEPEWSPDLLVEIVRSAGPQGITPKGMQAELERRGVRVSDKTLFKHLGAFVEQGRLDRADGRYTLP